MRTYRVAPFLAALLAAVAGPAVPGALADAVDELAEGHWEGTSDWDLGAAGGGTTADPAPATTDPPPPPESGTPTPVDDGPADGDPAPDGSPDSDGEPPMDTPGGSTDPSTPAGPTPGPTPALPNCGARWVVEVLGPDPKEFDQATLLTFTLFRTDGFAFVCNGYARSISTWYVDWFAETIAHHDGLSEIALTLRLEGACPNCHPSIALNGISQLDARAQVKTQWGTVDDSSTAEASSSTTWAGDIDCGDRCNARITGLQTGGSTGLEMGPLRLTAKSTKSFVYVEAPAGRGASKTVKKDRTDLIIVDRGSVTAEASGTEDNAQAKTRSGYCLLLRGTSACGAWGEYRVDLED